MIGSIAVFSQCDWVSGIGRRIHVAVDNQIMKGVGMTRIAANIKHSYHCHYLSKLTVKCPCSVGN